jgi:hypothetical protein
MTLTPHAAGGADPVLRRAAEVEIEPPVRRGGRGDGLG